MAAPSGDYSKSIVCMIRTSETEFLLHFFPEMRAQITSEIYSPLFLVQRTFFSHNFAEIRLKYLLILLIDGLTERHAEQVTVETQNLAWT